MKRRAPTDTQIAVLLAVAEGDCWEWTAPSGALTYTYRAGRLPAPSVRVALIEKWVEVGEHVPIAGLDSIQHHKPLRLTDAGRDALGTNLGGGS